MFIHIEIGKIFFENKNSGESIYDFFYLQQNYSKKLLKMKFIFSADYKAYVSKYLMAEKSTNDDKYNMLTKKNSKFCFYNFDDYLDRLCRPVERVRHSIVSENEHGFLELLRKVWLCFIEKKVLELFEGEKIDLNEFDDLEGELLPDIVSNLQICKYFYNTLYNSVADNFREMILSGHYFYIQSINEDAKLNGWSLVNIQDHIGNRDV